MELDVYQPTFMIEIEGRRLSKDITTEIVARIGYVDDPTSQLGPQAHPQADPEGLRKIIFWHSVLRDRRADR